MPLPPDLTSITLTGTFLDAAGNPLDGTVTVAPTVQVADSVGRVIIAPAPVYQILAAGTFSITGLVPTDSANLAPAGWAYTVTTRINGIRSVNTYFLPSSLAPTVDLADLTPATVGPIVTAYAQLDAANDFTEPNTFDGPVALNDGLTINDVAIANPPGGDSDFLRADGTWATPPGGSGGGTPSNAVTAQTTFGLGSSAGSATDYSRGDHAHGTPTLPAATISVAGIVQIDGTAGDIQPLGAQAAGSSGLAADAKHVHPTTGVVTTFNQSAARWGLKAETIAFYSGNLSATLTSGTLFLMLLEAPANQQISKLSAYVTSVGSGFSGVNQLALYTSAGALLSTTGDMTSNFGSTGWQEGTLASPQNPTTDTTYYVGILTHATTTVKIWAFNMAATVGAVNGFYPAIDFAGQASHASFTPGSGTLNSGAYWFGAR